MKDAYGDVALTHKLVAPVARRYKLLDWRHMAIGFGIASVVSAGIFGLVWARWDNSAVIPGRVRSSVNFPIYQPGQLPAGFVVDRKSFALNADVVTFAVRNGEQEVVFTEQAIPRQLDIDSFYANQLTDMRRMSTNMGRAVIGYFGDTELGSLTTERTWILVRAKQGVSSSQMDAIMQGISN